jgi:hypothetical protein
MLFSPSFTAYQTLLGRLAATERARSAAPQLCEDSDGRLGRSRNTHTTLVDAAS